MNHIKQHLLTFALLFAVLASAAQGVSVKADIRPIEIRIGEQAVVTLSVTMPEGKNAKVPIFQPLEQITPGVEVLTSMEQGVTSDGSGNVTRRIDYLLTSFDDTLYLIPPFNVEVEGNTYQSEPLALKVITINVDTTNTDVFYRAKDVQNPPFLWTEWQLPFWLSTLFILLLTFIFFLYLRLRANKPIKIRLRVVKHVPAHQKAIDAINQLKSQSGEYGSDNQEKQKEYYTRLTDTIRRYIEERYGFSALEMTSGEIIDKLQESGDPKRIQELREVFATADLVKFAKHSAMLGENDANLMNAIAFVNDTKLTGEQVSEQVVREKETKQEQMSRIQRNNMKIMLIASAVLSVLLLAYIAYRLYDLLS